MTKQGTNPQRTDIQGTKAIRYATNIPQTLSKWQSHPLTNVGHHRRNFHDYPKPHVLFLNNRLDILPALFHVSHSSTINNLAKGCSPTPKNIISLRRIFSKKTARTDFEYDNCSEEYFVTRNRHAYSSHEVEINGRGLRWIIQPHHHPSPPNIHTNLPLGWIVFPPLLVRYPEQIRLFQRYVSGRTTWPIVTVAYRQDAEYVYEEKCLLGWQQAV
jgi:hypothetical protein